MSTKTLLEKNIARLKTDIATLEHGGTVEDCLSGIFGSTTPEEQLAEARKNLIATQGKFIEWLKSPTLTLYRILPATLLIDALNKAFEQDKEENHTAGGNAFLCGEEGYLVPRAAWRLAYEGKPVFLQVNSYWFYRSKDDSQSNRNAWNLLQQLDLEEYSTGDGDGYGILSYRVNLNG